MIRALIETSLVDWDGKISTVLFFDACNFRCPFCQNWELICTPEQFPVVEWQTIKEKLKKKQGWVDGVVLTGGEPLINKKEVSELSKKIKDLGLAVKLDTNGSSPGTMRELINTHLIDFVAMDVKAPLDERYATAAGSKVNLATITESITALMSGHIEYEFRTTCVPGIIDKTGIEQIGQAIKGARRWALQAYVPENAYKEEYRKELPEEYMHQLDEYLTIAKQYVGTVILRGKK
jgi:pyruvate formate lyase activating enzyme